ncbi:MAG TPA: GMC family oxidoreductase N-terminal domain-containing protein [Candidatus Acidoferrum sp.]|nr:GMC family oxidoreductase N-terminal domain-containing protein [Candidatus Acidoferrum sp.]
MAELRSFDYIIVGGGTAACVLASRLTEDASIRVLVIEAGSEPTSPWIKMPLAMGKLFTHPTLNWGLYTEPEARLNNRTIFWPRGKVLGGCSSINGSAYVRGQKEDYDGWRALGNIGWGWSDVLPYFQKLERREDLHGPSANGTGKLTVSYPVFVSPISRAFIEAGVRAGLPAAKDLNGDSPEGIGLMPYSIRHGERNSAYEAYLRPVRGRRNLTVETSAFALRLSMAGRRTTGVEYECGGAIEKALATREVIVAAGTIGSPQILMLSGIGPAQHLRELGIPVVVDAPGVGENLHDHVSGTCTYRTAPENSLNRELSGLAVVGHAITYYLAKRGPLTNGASQATALARSLPGTASPDLQLVFRAMSYVYDKSGRIAADPIPRVTGGIAFTQPKSRGRLRLKSADPKQAPLMNANYLSVASDEDRLVAGMKLMRRIFATEPVRSMVLGEDAPGEAVRSDEELREHLHATSATFCHPSGTCKMGQDAMAVVDERLRVRGVESLRVVDASIMPQLPSCGPAPAVFMIGEKAADLIKEDRSSGAVSLKPEAAVSATSGS